jgi:hypothetical protein
MAFIVINRRRSRRESQALERIATALDDIRDFLRPTLDADDSIEITSIEKPQPRDEDEEILPDTARM